ncbi:hypothetical protein BJ138DRAFT_1166527 [Hygrophoropsis aurantiaca]|uniref:Uncharacterized protein n=1 Tax=Hygrophoropsis aurantiaca TaxID=72124 RepID=A0ACB7ZT75_9AGAM|nr:hypothetical protein BJ138DRAFT_1166527 [Hygrophoropsis aurantiaca]
MVHRWLTFSRSSDPNISSLIRHWGIMTMGHALAFISHLCTTTSIPMFPSIHNVRRLLYARTITRNHALIMCRGGITRRATLQRRKIGLPLCLLVLCRIQHLYHTRRDWITLQQDYSNNPPVGWRRRHCLKNATTPKTQIPPSSSSIPGLSSYHINLHPPIPLPQAPELSPPALRGVQATHPRRDADEHGLLAHVDRLLMHVNASRAHGDEIVVRAVAHAPLVADALTAEHDYRTPANANAQSPPNAGAQPPLEAAVQPPLETFYATPQAPLSACAELSCPETNAQSSCLDSALERMTGHHMPDALVYLHCA